MTDMERRTKDAEATFLGFSAAKIMERAIEGLGEAVQKVTEAFVILNAEEERFKFGLSGLVEHGQIEEIVTGLNHIAVSSPFAAKTMQSVTQSMLAAGYTGDNLVDTMQKLADVAAAGTDGDLVNLATALKNVKEQGMASSATIETFTRSGSGFRKFLAEKFVPKIGGEDEDAYQLRVNFMLKSMTLTGERFTKVFNEYAETQKGKASEASKTLAGSLNRVNEAFKQMILLTTAPAFTQLAGRLSDIADFMTGAKHISAPDFFKALGHYTAQDIDHLSNAIVELLTKASAKAAADPSASIAMIKAAGSIIGALVSAIPRIALAQWAFIASAFAGIGKAMGEGLVKGLEGGNFLEWFTSRMIKFLGDTINSIRSYLGIASPSKRMADDVGRPMALGIIEGLLNSGTTIAKGTLDFMKMFGTLFIRTIQVDLSNILKMLGVPIIVRALQDFFRLAAGLFTPPHAVRDIGTAVIDEINVGAAGNPGNQQSFLDAIGLFLSQVANNLASVIPQPIKDFAGTVWGFLTGHTQMSYFTTTFWTDLTTELGNMWNGIVNLIPQPIKDFAGTVWTWLTSHTQFSYFTTTFWTNLQSGLGDLWNGIMGLIPDSIKNFPGTVWNWISGGFISNVGGTGIFTSISDFLHNLTVTIFGGTDTSGNIKTGLLADFANFPGKVWAWLSTGFTSFVGGSEIYRSISDFLHNLTVTIFGGTDTSGNTKTGLFADFVGFPGKVWTWISTGFTSFVGGSGIYNSVSDFLHNLTVTVFGGVDTSGNSKSGLLSDFASFPSKIWGWISAGFTSFVGASGIYGSISTFLHNLTVTIFGGTDSSGTQKDGLLSQFSNFPTTIWGWISSGFETFVGATGMYASISTFLHNLTVTIFGGTDTSGAKKDGLFANFINLPSTLWGWISSGFDVTNWQNTGLWTSITDFADKIKKGILSFPALKDTVNAIDTSFKETFASLSIAGSGTASAIRDFISNVFKNLGNLIAQGKTGLEGGLKEVSDYIGGAIIEGIATGIRNVASGSVPLVNAVQSMKDALLAAFKAVLGIRSPSKVMADMVGKPMALGIVQGLIDSMPLVQGAIDKYGNLSLDYQPSGGLGTTSGLGGGSGQTIQTTLVIDGQALGQIVWNYLKGQSTYGATMGITTPGLIPAGGG